MTACTKSSSVINLLVPMHYTADPSNNLAFMYRVATATNRKLVRRYVREREHGVPAGIR